MKLKDKLFIIVLMTIMLPWILIKFIYAIVLNMNMWANTEISKYIKRLEKFLTAEDQLNLLLSEAGIEF